MPRRRVECPYEEAPSTPPGRLSTGLTTGLYQNWAQRVRASHKTELVMLRTTLEEKTRWTAAALQWGGTLSDWLRQAAEEAIEIGKAQAEFRALVMSKPPKKKRTGKRVA